MPDRPPTGKGGEAEMNFFNPFRLFKKQEHGLFIGIALGMAFWGTLGLIVWMVRL
jgi:hypothetical protein